MSFLSILKAIGKNFTVGIHKAIAFEVKALPLEKEIATAITFIPGAGAIGTTLLDLVTVVGRVEQITEAVGATNGSGPQKLAVALPDIEQAILSDPLFKGRQVSNLDKYNKALVAFTGAIADIADSFASTTVAPVAAPIQTPVAFTPAAIKVPTS